VQPVVILKMKYFLKILCFCFFIHFFSCHSFAELRWKWLYLQCNLISNENYARTQSLIREAKEAGYNGVVLADSKFEKIESQPIVYKLRLKNVKNIASTIGIELIPRFFNLGYPSSILSHDTSLAEAMPVKEAVLVAERNKLVFGKISPVFEQGDFKLTLANKLAGFNGVDHLGSYIRIDDKVFHSIGTSLRFKDVDKTPRRYARVTKSVKLIPHKQYRISLWLKTENLNPQNVSALVIDGRGKHLNRATFIVKKNQDWSKHELVFNSQDSGNASLIIAGYGVAGTFWVDDIELTECFGVNLVRREGCPLSMSNWDSTVSYAEGSDFDYVTFDDLGRRKWPGTYHRSHEDMMIRLLPGSRIKNGQKVKISYYHVPIVNQSQVGICLSNPKTYDILEKQFKSLNALLKPEKIFIGCDEIRVLGHCGLCKSNSRIGGQILAEAIKKCRSIILKYNPDAEIFVWSDVFDPYHNASTDSNYYISDSLEGSWEGLTDDFRVVNWNFFKSEQSLVFFNRRGHRQLIAGFYDKPDWGKSLNDWLKEARKLEGPKVEGVMYCTWKNDFSTIKEFLDLALTLN